jgi:PilZ domain
VQMRESVRFRTQRVPVACEVQAGSLVPRTRIDLVCLDGSSTGLRAGGVGRALGIGDVVRLELGDQSEPHWIVARVVRVVQLSFGRWEAGFQFMPKTTEERAWLIAWRDSIAVADPPGM